ncbi:hypothetical protein AB0F81_11675 [Actinoplanes sp. NPDC024001]|uniref:hypothetical protein n=1 Tax=Actinoplanes sp. NPDC024001 TaxID=3154598 RepID=UPI0033F45FE3
MTTLKFVLTAAIVIGLGIFCLYLGGEETRFWREHSALRTLMEQLGGLLIVSGLLSVLWELVGKRAFAREVLDDTRLATELEASGIKRVGVQFFEEAVWEECFKGVEKLDIFVAYAQTWRNINLTRLRVVAQKPSGRIRIYLPDPDDAQTIQTLSARFGFKPEELRQRIEATKQDFEALKVPNGASVEVFYWRGDRLFTFYRFDNKVILSMYRHTGRSPVLPTFVCESGGSLFQFVYDELRVIREASRSATAAGVTGTVTPITKGTG